VFRLFREELYGDVNVAITSDLVALARSMNLPDCKPALWMTAVGTNSATSASLSRQCFSALHRQLLNREYHYSMLGSCGSSLAHDTREPDESRPLDDLTYVAHGFNICQSSAEPVSPYYF
jgi:hypothetical protein